MELLSGRFWIPPKRLVSTNPAVALTTCMCERLRPRTSFRVVACRDIVADGEPGYNQHKQQVERRVWGRLFSPERVASTLGAGRLLGIELRSTDSAFVGYSLSTPDSCRNWVKSDELLECYRAFHVSLFSTDPFSHWCPTDALRCDDRIRSPLARCCCPVLESPRRRPIRARHRWRRTARSESRRR